MVTDAVPVPTIGIGAGRHCDGQVLVYHDILGFEDRVRPKFVRRYADLHSEATRAIGCFAADVRAGSFPASCETYHAADTVSEALGLYGSEEHVPA
jgi:3-methyl-2-oxobutanoate hydroxymethyltransferase